MTVGRMRNFYVIWPGGQVLPVQGPTLEWVAEQFPAANVYSEFGSQATIRHDQPRSIEGLVPKRHKPGRPGFLFHPEPEES